MSRIIRRFARPENVTQAMPDVIAVCMDCRSGKHALVAYVGITLTNLGIGYMKFMEDQHMLAQARDNFPDMDLDMDGKHQSMIHTIWTDGAYRQCPGAVVDATICPPHDHLVDEAVEVLGESHIKLTATLYNLGLTTRKDPIGVDVVDIPQDEIDMMMGMAGSLVVEVNDGRMTYEVHGDFSEDRVEEAVKRIAALDLPGPDMFSQGDSDNS